MPGQKVVAVKQVAHNRIAQGRVVLQGFTLIEMLVVISVLTVLVAFIFPNLTAIESSRRFREQEAALLRLQAEARNESLRNRSPVTLRVEGSTVIMERVPTDADPVEVQRVELTQEFKVAKTRLGNDDLDADSWAWTTYPDGSADTGGLEFEEGSAIRSLLLPADKEGYWADGELPEVLQERWTAGELQQR